MERHPHPGMIALYWHSAGSSPLRAEVLPARADLPAGYAALRVFRRRGQLLTAEHPPAGAFAPEEEMPAGVEGVMRAPSVAPVSSDLFPCWEPA